MPLTFPLQQSDSPSLKKQLWEPVVILISSDSQLLTPESERELNIEMSAEQSRSLVAAKKTL